MQQPNTLFLITGMPAVGKTTFAAKLAKHLNACLLDIDTATEPIIQAAMKKLGHDPDDRDSELFKETFREPVYRTLFAIAAENLPNTHVVITGPFTRELKNPTWPGEISRSLATSCRVKCLFLHCDQDLRKRRIEQRANPRDAAKLASWNQHLAYYDTQARPSYPHLAVDTGLKNAFESALNSRLWEEADWPDPAR